MSEPGGKPRQPPARMELLIRAADGEGFETQELASGSAYRQLRPQRIPDSQWEVAELPAGVRRTRTYVLKNRNTERYLMLSEPERFLWDQMDGRAKLQDIAAAYVMRYGAFDFEIIPGLIQKLHGAELLTLRPISRLREVLARNRSNPAARAAEATLHALERLTVSSRRSNDVFERIHRYGGFLLFTPVAVVVLAVLALLAVRATVVLWKELGQIGESLGDHAVMAIVLVKAAFWLTVVLHQMMHALACVHYGRRVREFGFTMLHGFIPTFYADVTDIFMASRRARIVNALAGPLVHLFLGTSYLVWASHLGPGLLQGCLAASAMLQLQSFFVSLYPFCFLEMDGYHVLVDSIGMPTLNHDSLAFVRHGLWRRLGQGRWLRRLELIYVGYFVLSLVSIVAAVWATLAVIVHAVRA